MKKTAFIFFLIILFCFSLEAQEGEASSMNMGLGFKQSPSSNAQLMIMRFTPSSEFPMGIEAGLSLWNDGTNTNFHIEALAIFKVLDYSPGIINFFGGIQLTLVSGNAPLWLRTGLEVEFFLTEKISILAEGALNFNLTSLPEFGNSGGAVGTGFLFYL